MNLKLIANPSGQAFIEMMQRQPSVLLVGSTGFLGRAALDAFMSAGISPVLLNREPHSGFAGKQYRLSDLETVSEAIDAVVNLAAVIPYGKMTAFSGELFEVNAGLAFRLQQRFPSAHHLYASSVSVYDANAVQPIEETAATSPDTAYGASKLAGEAMVRMAPRHTILRFSSLYGLGMTAKTLLPTLVATARQGRAMTLYGDGRRTQDYLHVRDAARMLLIAMNNPHPGIYNAVSSQPVSNVQLAELVASFVPGARIVFSGTDRSPSLSYCGQKFRSVFAAEPMVPLSAGVEEMVRNGG